MLVKGISAASFRNLAPFNIVPDEKMNVICGENAQGKTNLLEAVWLFTGAKSFRTNNDKELCNLEEEKCKINITFCADSIENTAEINISGRRSAVFNEKKLSSASLLAGKFCAIVFSPDDLSLISGSPEKRRRFLDVAISQIYPKYIDTLRRYTRCLAQRNYLLKEIKQGTKNEIGLEVYENELAEAGKAIIRYRIRYLELAEPFITEIYKGISSFKESFRVKYLPVCEPENLLKRLIETRNDDILTGFTSVGPHRDDLDFLIDELSVRSYGSQGQKRSVALALKLSEAEVLNKVTGEYPVALLDDVMSELDPARQNYVLNHISKLQVFLTCCDPANINNLSTGTVFKIEDGKITEITKK
ncbi:MAG: DNA replication/repair protein RecF [Clostridia bacterium]|nr:DNA replication/repair protein RecF [Clostridia bacterium]